MKLIFILGIAFFPFISLAQETADSKKSSEIYQESVPEFPGGMSKFYSFVKKEMKYPADARKNGIQGKVFVQFEIDTAGYVISESVKVVQSLSKSVDDEAQRIMKKCPKWKPAYQNDKPVKVSLILPITFKL